ncbi:MAG TPA: RDD family protein [Rugosimonospora sp.]
MSLNAPGGEGLRLFSGDAVELDIRIARLGSRALARLIDLVVQVVLTLLVSTLLTTITINIRSLADDALITALWIVTLVVVLIGYPTLLESMTAGRTLGKLVMGLRVIRDDGGPVRFRHALTRALVGVAVEFPALGTGVAEPVGWLISLWTMLVNPAGKRLGDLAAGTIVIHDRTPSTWGWVPAMPPHLAGWATTLDLTGLDDDLALAVRHYLARNRELREPARSRLGFALASEVAECTTPQPPPGTPGWAYLAAVLAERNLRSVRRLARTRMVTDRIWPELSRAVRVEPARPAVGSMRAPTPPA